MPLFCGWKKDVSKYLDVGNPDLYELIVMLTLTSRVALDILWDIYMFHLEYYAVLVFRSSISSCL